MTDRGSAPIFVVGYQHSGTTLLQYMLGLHSDVYTSHFETKFFEHLKMIRNRFPELDSRSALENYAQFLIDIIYGGYVIKDGYTLGGETSDSVPDVAETDLKALVDCCLGQANHASVFCAVHGLVARTHGKKRWVEKTPTHIYYVDDIVASVPGAIFIEMVRDPRDILASKKTRRSRAYRESLSSQLDRRILSLALAYDPILDTVSWKSAIRAGQQAAKRHPARFKRLRYEDLLFHAESCLHDLCAFAHLRFENEMLAVSGRGGAEWEKHQDKVGIDPTRTGRWRQVLTAREVAACQAAGGEEMVVLGYEPAPVSTLSRCTRPLLWFRSAAGLVWRLWSKWSVGGPGYFLNVMGNWRQRWKALRPD